MFITLKFIECKQYSIHHETCIDNIRSSFEARFNVPVTCAFTSDSETVYARTWWGIVEPNYGMIMCGELTYVAVNQSILNSVSAEAGSACSGQSGYDFNVCANDYINSNGGARFCAGARSWNLLVAAPSKGYWSGWGGAYSYAGSSYVTAFCIYR
ncbi:unnamed protein product [Oikopleura dioica]|uniref:Uncharacterized protein n=1 Tax=Oikopleura dioica TaxID=34765 RepID=E4XS97_OIKDI|nr:unnamed protein product [Oikopleura dioica]